MVKSLKPEDLKKVVRHDENYDSADAALDSIGERLAKKQLMMQELQGRSAEEIQRDMDSTMNKAEQKEIYKKFFNEEDAEEVKQKEPTEQEILAQK